MNAKLSKIESLARAGNQTLNVHCILLRQKLGAAYWVVSFENAAY